MQLFSRNQFLTLNESYENESRATKLSENEAIEILKTLTPEQLNVIKTKPIWRGISNNENFLEIDPKKFSRKSANTSNEYTLLIDNSPNWKDYPKRSESLICTFSTSTALNFGYDGYHVVIPLEKNAKLGICKASDFWWSFNHKGVNNMEDFNSFFHKTRYQLLRSNEIIKNYDDLIKIINDIDEQVQIQRKSGSRINFDFFKMINWKFKEPLLKCIEDYLDPIKNNFQLVNYYQDDFTHNLKSEVWTDSKSLLIHFDSGKSKLWNELLSKLT